MDANTGLVYFGARYYDPDTARFISQDSYQGKTDTPPSLHRYLYAYSNPTVYIDPDGNDVLDVGKDIWNGITKAASETRKALPVISRELNKVTEKVANSFTPTTTAGQVAATLNYTVGDFIVGNVIAPITALGAAEEARENPTKQNLFFAALAVSPYGPKGAGKTLKKLLGKETVIAEKLLTKESRSGINVVGKEVIDTAKNESAEHANVVDNRIQQMHENMNEGEKARTTYGAALVELEGGKQEMWVGAAGKKGYVPPRIRGNDRVISNKVEGGNGINRLNDAEQTLMREADAQNANILAIGATRDMCISCQEAATARGILDKVVTPLKQ
jgi:RHS repeat-associated protein